jgi:hypothetical protein
MIKSISIGKIGEQAVNEDAVSSRDKIIAVSDGAGGGGLFAEKWSNYLVCNLPDTPIITPQQFDEWLSNIWEPFYNQYEIEAKNMGGLALDKFYDEGSFATLAAVWQVSTNECRWMSYGDSVAFCYNHRDKNLLHSFGNLSDFDNPPYLINCKDELNPNGFKSGTFNIDADSIVFVTSDALAHYVLMMFEVANSQQYDKELSNAEQSHTKNENFIKSAKGLRKIDFEKEVIKKLNNSSSNSTNFERHISSLLRKGLIAYDDYSIAILKNDSEQL